MYRIPVRPQRSQGAPHPDGRFPSPSSCWPYPGDRSPYGGPGHRGASPRICPTYSPGSPGFSPGFSPGSSPGSNRGYRDRSPGGFSRGSRRFGGPMRHRGDGFRRPQSFSPNFQASGSVEKYFSPSMLQDPWASLQPLTAADAGRSRSNN
ncbi:hypothetical protein Q5P01_023004 [Channa striata]|uniref:M-phase-specific PLK1-interacting protein n=1 Tax=Channa striata TaxID=64152 RepID=A0AA88S4G4_CHASR|nr:hypothetical protein Q5P01_023004 [Channa striata]